MGVRLLNLLATSGFLSREYFKAWSAAEYHSMSGRVRKVLAGTYYTMV